MKVGIVGAGATGLAAARVLATEGYDVTVLEASSELGGLAGSIKVHGTWVERFYHHLFGTDRDAVRLVRDVGLGDRLQFRPASVGIYYDGQLHDFSTPQAMLRFPPLRLPSRARFAAASALLKATRRWQRLEDVNALAWSRRYSGAPATDVIWRPLLEGKFGPHAEDVSMAWLWARVHYRTFRLGYLHGGFGLLYEALADDVRRRGARIRLDSPVQRISAGDGGRGAVVTGVDGSATQFDKLLVTIPEPAFSRALGRSDCDGPSARRYLGATCFILELDRSLVPYYWLNVNDPTFPFLAVVEHTRLVDPQQYAGRHLVYVGNYVDHDDWRFRSSPEDLLAAYLPYLQRLNPTLRREHILAWHFSKAPYAQPIVTPGYRATIPPHTTPLPDVMLATMSQVYPQDRGQNYAIAMGERVARSLVGAAAGGPGRRGGGRRRGTIGAPEGWWHAGNRRQQASAPRGAGVPEGARRDDHRENGYGHSAGRRGAQLHRGDH